jgi:hypothetical protein
MTELVSVPARARLMGFASADVVKRVVAAINSMLLSPEITDAPPCTVQMFALRMAIKRQTNREPDRTKVLLPVKQNASSRNVMWAAVKRRDSRLNLRSF